MHSINTFSLYKHTLSTHTLSTQFSEHPILPTHPIESFDHRLFSTTALGDLLKVTVSDSQMEDMQVSDAPSWNIPYHYSIPTLEFSSTHRKPLITPFYVP